MKRKSMHHVTKKNERSEYMKQTLPGYVSVIFLSEVLKDHSKAF